MTTWVIKDDAGDYLSFHKDIICTAADRCNAWPFETRQAALDKLATMPWREAWHPRIVKVVSKVQAERKRLIKVIRERLDDWWCGNGWKTVDEELGSLIAYLEGLE